MLSFLFRMIRDFHLEHGFYPNTLYINHFHYHRLRDQLPKPPGDNDLARFLTVDIIVSEAAVHPHVAWLGQAGRQRAIG